jgi:metal-dependent hydrolase (beta-lactamase superfamily II)
LPVDGVESRLTGCTRAGIVNITRYALALIGTPHVDAVLSGFQLNGPLFEPLIEPVWTDPATCSQA